ncbi:MAG: hypothetical protein V3T17_11245 [Pseudomonadales bacterium]
MNFPNLCQLVYGLAKCTLMALTLIYVGICLFATTCYIEPKKGFDIPKDIIDFGNTVTLVGNIWTDTIKTESLSLQEPEKKDFTDAAFIEYVSQCDREGYAACSHFAELKRLSIDPRADTDKIYLTDYNAGMIMKVGNAANLYEKEAYILIILNQYIIAEDRISTARWEESLQETHMAILELQTPHAQYHSSAHWNVVACILTNYDLLDSIKESPVDGTVYYTTAT